MTAPTGLAFAHQLLATKGWIAFPVAPMGKAALLSKTFDNPATTHAELDTLWARAAWRLRNAEEPDLASVSNLAPNVAINLGASRLAVVDADTPGQVAAWLNLCTENGYLPGPPTVQTPGARGTDGELKHRDGGHWYYSLPAELTIVGGLDVKLGDGEPASLLAGRRYVLCPPSVRAEGPYVALAQTIPEAPPFILAAITEAQRAATPVRYNRRSDGLVGVSGGLGAASAEEWEWFCDTPWTDVLPEGWHVTSESREGCEIFARPGGSSERAAQAHASECGHVPGDDGSYPPPITVFTSEVDEHLAAALAETASGRSVSKLRLWAHLYTNGDVGAARQVLGLNRSHGTEGGAA